MYESDNRTKLHSGSTYITMERINRRQKGSTREAEGSQGMGQFLGDNSRFTNSREEDSARRIEEGVGEECRLGEVKSIKEMVEVPALGLEQLGEVGGRNGGGFRIGNWGREGAHDLFD
jgi:hypothetical protein